MVGIICPTFQIKILRAREVQGYMTKELVAGGEDSPSSFWVESQDSLYASISHMWP